MVIKMKKRFLFALTSLMLLASCSKSYIRYGIKKPYITLEASNSDKGELKDLLPSEIKQKIQNEDTFMLYVHSSTCSHCLASQETFLNPYLEKNKVIIYGIEFMSFHSNEEEYKVYEGFKNDFGKSFQGFPYYALYQSGVFIRGEQEAQYFQTFFDAYIITETQD